MKRVNYNELRHLLPHLRENLCTGRQVYHDQRGVVQFENPHTRDLYAGLIKHHGGVREGYLRGSKDDPHLGRVRI